MYFLARCLSRHLPPRPIYIFAQAAPALTVSTRPIAPCAPVAGPRTASPSPRSAALAVRATTACVAPATVRATIILPATIALAENVPREWNTRTHRTMHLLLATCTVVRVAARARTRRPQETLTPAPNVRSAATPPQKGHPSARRATRDRTRQLRGRSRACLAPPGRQPRKTPTGAQIAKPAVTLPQKGHPSARRAMQRRTRQKWERSRACRVLLARAPSRGAPGAAAVLATATRPQAALLAKLASIRLATTMLHARCAAQACRTPPHQAPRR